MHHGNSKSSAGSNTTRLDLAARRASIAAIAQTPQDDLLLPPPTTAANSAQIENAIGDLTRQDLLNPPTTAHHWRAIETALDEALATNGSSTRTPHNDRSQLRNIGRVAFVRGKDSAIPAPQPHSCDKECPHSIRPSSKIPNLKVRGNDSSLIRPRSLTVPTSSSSTPHQPFRPVRPLDRSTYGPSKDRDRTAEGVENLARTVPMPETSRPSPGITPETVKYNRFPEQDQEFDIFRTREALREFVGSIGRRGRGRWL